MAFGTGARQTHSPSVRPFIPQLSAIARGAKPITGRISENAKR
jgi:hypothetical protein